VEAAMTERQKNTVLKMPKHERDNWAASTQRSTRANF